LLLLLLLLQGAKLLPVLLHMAPVLNPAALLLVPQVKMWDRRHLMEWPLLHAFKHMPNQSAAAPNPSVEHQQ
jgi:hypothetical protein